MYLYHANAVALGGTFVRPFQQTINSQAACSIPSAGGTASSRAEKFNFNGVISFDSAQSDLTAGVEQRNGTTVHVCRVSVVVEGLNVLNMFMADRVVARLASEHIPLPSSANSNASQSKPAGALPRKNQITAKIQSNISGSQPLDEPRIITTGCHFDNLRIAGHPVELEYAHEKFHLYDTYTKLQQAYKNNRQDVVDCLLGYGLKMSGNDDEPQHLKDVYNGYQQYVDDPAKKRKARATLDRVVVCSFVKKAAINGSGSEIKNCGSVIVVPQFGTIYLGEVIISPAYRRVNMFRLELGSPDGGSVAGPSGDSNGGGYP